MKLWLARHARTHAPEGTCYGALDVEADPQATQEAAQVLAEVLPAAMHVRCSPLRRCMHLAQSLQALRPDLLPVADPRIAEMDFGAWEGQRWDALGPAAFEAWMADFASHRCGGGESVSALMERTADALAQVRAGQGDVLWITHAGVVRAVRLLLRGVSVPAQASDWPEEGLPFGGWVCLALGQPRENAVTR